MQIGYKVLELYRKNNKYYLASLRKQPYNKLNIWKGNPPQLNAECYIGHKAPHDDCQCGIYSLSDPMEVLTQGYHSWSMGPAVLVKLAIYGKILVGSRGYRSEKAEVIQILPLTCSYRNCTQIGESFHQLQFNTGFLMCDAHCFRGVNNDISITQAAAQLGIEYNISSDPLPYYPVGIDANSSVQKKAYNLWQISTHPYYAWNIKTIRNNNREKAKQIKAHFINVYGMEEKSAKLFVAYLIGRSRGMGNNVLNNYAATRIINGKKPWLKWIDENGKNKLEGQYERLVGDD